MKYLLSNWRQFKDKIRGKKIILLLDYDGTLCPIKRTPRLAVIPHDVKALLEKLSGMLDCKLAIISGRSLEDIKNIIGIRGIIYSGNHGFEIEGPKIKFHGSIPYGYRRMLESIKRKLHKKFNGVKGAILEDKEYSLGIHYRLASKSALSAIKKAFYEVVMVYLIKGKIKIRYGKKVFEVMPPNGWDKGKVVSWLLSRKFFSFGAKMAIPIYLGDDLTDEDAFQTLKNKGLTIFIGKPKMSSAKYYLRNVGQVKHFLKEIIKFLEGA